MRLLLGVLAALALVACSSAPEQTTPAAAVPTTAPVATETAASEPTEPPAPEIDTSKVPERINRPYLDEVMNDLDQQLGRVLRTTKRGGKFDEAFHAGLRAVYTNQAASAQAQGFIDAVGIKGLARRPKNPTTDVEEIIEATPTCVYFTAQRDLNPVLRGRIDPIQPYYLALERQRSDANPTAWVIALDTWYRSGKPPAAVCEVD